MAEKCKYCFHNSFLTACEVCGAKLCTMHINRLMQKFSNDTSVARSVHISNYTRVFPPGNKGFLTLNLCSDCYSGMLRQPPWEWKEIPDLKSQWRPADSAYGVPPLTGLEGLEALIKAVEAMQPIMPTKENMAATKAAKTDMERRWDEARKKKPEEKPPETDPQMQRLLDLLDREVL